MTRNKKLLLWSVVLVPVLAVVALLVAAPRLVSKFTPAITANLTKVVGAPVSFGEITLSILPKLAFSIADLRVETTTGEATPLHLGKLTLRVSLADLLSGDLRIEHVLIKNVQADLVKDKDGTVHLRGVARKAASPRTAVRGTSESVAVASTGSDAGSFSLAVERAELSAVSVKLEDLSAAAPVVTSVSNLSGSAILERSSGDDFFAIDLLLTASDIIHGKLLTKPINQPLRVSAKGRKRGESVSIEKGEITLDRSRITFSGEVLPRSALSMQIGVQPLELAEVAELLPALREAELGGQLEGAFEVKAPFESNGLPLMKGEVRGKNIRHASGTSKTAIEIPSLTFGLDGKNATATVTQVKAPQATIEQVNWNGTINPEVVGLAPLEFQLAGGTGKVEGEYRTAKDARTDLHLNLAAMDLSTLTAPLRKDSAIQLAGKLQQLESRVSFLQANLKGSIRGDLNLQAGPGSIEGMNLFSSVVGQLQTIPEIGTKLKESLPPEFEALLTSSDTAFEVISARTRFVEGGRIDIDDFALQHPIYVFNGRGTVQPSGDFEIRSQMTFGGALVARLIEKEKNFKYALNSSGNLEIPVIIRKSGSNTVVIPDADRLLRNAAASGALDAAEKALNKVSPKFGGTADTLKKLFR